jgi:hypothetical protein
MRETSKREDCVWGESPSEQPVLATFIDSFFRLSNCPWIRQFTSLSYSPLLHPLFTAPPGGDKPGFPRLVFWKKNTTAPAFPEWEKETRVFA